MVNEFIPNTLGQLDGVDLGSGVEGEALRWRSGVWTGDAVHYEESRTIDGSDISNKYFDLARTPDNANGVRIFIDNSGIKAEQGVDYTISTNQISWNTYTWDGLLAVGDKLKIFYW